MLNRIYVHKGDLIHRPLWFHKLDVQETASGYGKKLRFPYMIKYRNKLRRIYVCQYSNVSTMYILVKGIIRIVDIVN